MGAYFVWTFIVAGAYFVRAYIHQGPSSLVVGTYFVYKYSNNCSSNSSMCSVIVVSKSCSLGYDVFTPGCRFTFAYSHCYCFDIIKLFRLLQFYEN